MQRTFIPRFVLWALAAACLSALAHTATAGSFLRGCAARDMQIVMMIEEREKTNSVSAEILSNAMHTMMHARIVCHEGHVLDALAIYDGIVQTIAPNPVLSGRPQSTGIQ